MNNKIIKKIFCAFLIITLSTVFFNVFATSNNGEALNNFTKKQYDLLFESNFSNISNEYGDIFDISNKINNFNNLAKKIKNSREKVEDENNKILNKITNFEETKAEIQNDIINLRKKIEELSLLSIQTKKEIETNEKKIEYIKSQIESNKKVLLEYIDYTYKKGNTAYQGDKIDNLKSIILNNEDISNVINDLYFSSIVQMAGKTLIERHMKFISDLYIEKVNLEKKKIEYSKLRKDFIIEQKNLKDKESFYNKLLEISKNKQQEYEKIISEKLKTENKLKEIALEQEKQIEKIKEKILSENNCEFIDISKLNEEKKEELQKNDRKCYNLNNIIFLENQLNRANYDTTNPMTWPVAPIRGLSAYYKDPEYKKVLGADHNAIDIRANQGSELKAAMSGYVIYINPPTSLDYAFLAIKHSNGYTTVYGHLSEINVKQYQFVEKGEIIGRTGGERGTLGAGFLSSGPHLHFEVFKDKQYIDPLDVLDISYLKYSSLPLSPAKYKLKYLTDFKARRGYELSEVEAKTKIFKIKGENEIERQKYLIEKYASGSFNNHQLWVNQALLGNIDPSVVMCIGLAESGLGRNLTTGYNVGNVGNNDRGDRVAYGSAKEGIYAIVRTLNNKYFKDVNRLDMLSGAGRAVSGLKSCKEKPCYATDPRYWHPNVITCLSHLKGRIVEDDYNFRIKK